MARMLQDKGMRRWLTMLLQAQEDLYGAYEAARVGGVNFFDTAEASLWGQTIRCNAHTMMQPALAYRSHPTQGWQQRCCCRRLLQVDG